MSVSELEILPYSEELAGDFLDINRQWIEQMFVMEATDIAMLNDPHRHIIAPGGMIWFARHARLGVVGTCALLNKGQGVFELTKMGVYEHARGMKVAEQLLHVVLAYVNSCKQQSLYLLTNTRCAAAIHLYEKNGFVHSEDIMQRYGKAYARCNVAMAYRPAGLAEREHRGKK
ncbi:GNAT family N-acetyltransferase [Lacimicrobium sp. SS2-24]|uniref:GNAT family N-acetyltransferase n=1 Tax=Lacimicrobium sp. SS2-24 TaxID=2005569 RepID=UPI000B4BA166|nr:GNAT family N-acetyltransferase [Lacimicrobium sp. SS2-24]